MQKYRSNLVLTALIFSIAILEGCATVPVPAGSKTYENALSILQQNTVPYFVATKRLELVSLFFDSSLETEQAELKIKKGIVYVESPLDGIKDAVLQSLPANIVSGNFVDARKESIDFCAHQLYGWILFKDGTWVLHYTFAGYQLRYEMWAGIYYQPDCNSVRGRSLWTRSCTANLPDTFTPKAWLAQSGEKLKAVRSEIINKCGKELAQDLARFLEQ